MENKQPSKRKLRLFKVLAFFVPIFLLLVIELMLRLFGYGHDTSLFIKYPDDANYWVMNKYASERYFSDTTNATKGGIELFKVKKAPNTFRIFVLGESTTAGYPYFHNGSFHRWLKYRLMHTYRDVNFEVINLSLTAVNSYTVLDFGKQIIDFEPDAVLAYVGHNEYYGALGIGSTSHIANNSGFVLFMLEFRKLRLVQLCRNLIRHFRSHSVSINERDNLMKRMAEDQQVVYQSPEFMAGVHQFEKNMDEVSQLMKAKNIPMFLSTLVSNEKDVPPFINDTNTKVINAAQQFKLADASFKSGDYPLAKKQYVYAKELDCLRFRAPEAMDSVILKLSTKYENVHLVDAKTLFEQNSPHGILGNVLLLEHVHPNLNGYALLSEAFYQAIKKAHLITKFAENNMSFDELLNKMPVTKVDSLLGAYTIMMLETGWPFNKAIPANYKRGNTYEEQLAGALSVNRISWLDAMNQLFQISLKSNDKKTALKAAEAVMLEYPQNITYKLFAGRLNYELGNPDEAIDEFKEAYDIEPSFPNTQNMYLVYLKTDQPVKALSYIDAAMLKKPNDYTLPGLKTVVGNIIQLEAKLKTLPTETNLSMQIAFDYHDIQIDEVASKYETLSKK